VLKRPFVARSRSSARVTGKLSNVQRENSRLFKNPYGIDIFVTLKKISSHLLLIRTTRCDSARGDVRLVTTASVVERAYTLR
jgi:hypothetical protein